MRITNMMMSNSMLTRINRNMSTLDKYYTQMASGKKIQKPSEDPILASRALKLRNTVSSTEQYISNSKQGLSWMELTESAYSNVTSILTTISELCVQGASDQYKEDDRQKIAQNINSLVGQIETEMNSTYMGRYIFSGYKTDIAPIIKDAATGKNILNPEIYSFRADKYLEIVNKDFVDPINDITKQIADLNGQISGSTGDTSALKAEKEELINKLKEQLKVDGMEITSLGDNVYLQTKMSGGGSGSGDSSTGPGTVFISIPIVEGTTAHPLEAKINSNGDGLDFTINGSSVSVIVPEGLQVSADRIKLEVGVNNYIDINLTAPESYTTEMYNELHYFDRIFDYMSGTLSAEDLNKYYDGKPFSELSVSEKSSFDKSLRESFDAMIAKVNDFNASITERQTNLGVRMSRLNLIQDRLDDDGLNYKSLMSKNEDVNYADVAMNLNVANASYTAALKTGMTITQLTLADFL